MTKSVLYRIDETRRPNRSNKSKALISNLAKQAGVEPETIRRLEEGLPYHRNTIERYAAAVELDFAKLGVVKCIDPTELVDAPSGGSPLEYLGLRTLVRSSPNPAYFLNPELIIQDCSPAFEELIDVRREEIVGEHLLYSVFPKILDRVQGVADPEFEERQTDMMREALRKKWIDVNDRMVVDNRGLKRGRYRGLFDVLIRGFHVKRLRGRTPYATYIYYLPTQLDEDLSNGHASAILGGYQNDPAKPVGPKQTGHSATEATSDIGLDAVRLPSVPLTPEVLRQRMLDAIANSNMSRRDIGVAMGIRRSAASQVVYQLLEVTKDPGIFTLQRFAEAVGTTLGKLIAHGVDERGAEKPATPATPT